MASAPALRFLLLAAVASGLGFAPARAAPHDEWPLEITNADDALSGRIRLAVSAESEPKLFRALLDDAKSALLAKRDDAAAARAEDEKGFERWELEISDETRFMDARLISVLRRITDYQGADKPKTSIFTYAFDREKKEPITFEDLFSDPADDGEAMKEMKATAIAALAPLKAQRRKTPEAEARKDLEAAIDASVSSFQNFTFAPSAVDGALGGIAVHFSPYEIGPPEEGEYEALIPQSAFRKYLTPAWVKAFAGAPRKLARLRSEQGRQAALYDQPATVEIKKRMEIKGEAPDYFFVGGPARLELAPADGGAAIASTTVEPAAEGLSSGAIEHGRAFTARIGDFTAPKAGAPLQLRLLEAPSEKEQDDDGEEIVPDRVLIPARLAE